MKIAQIGIGGWGKNHTRILSELDVLCAICDADTKKCKEYSVQYNVNAYSSVDDLLAKQEFDAAFVCTPTSTHFEIALQLINAKKHVFVEKPLTYDSNHAEQLLELAKKNKIILTCGYIERFNPAVHILKNFIKSNKYGPLVMLEFHRESYMPMHILDVGIIYDTSVHDIDIAMWLFDKTPNVVFAKAGHLRHEQEDFASIMLGFEDNHVAMISSNWITSNKIRKFSAVCTDAIISVDCVAQKIKVKKDQDTQTPQTQKTDILLLEIKNFIDTIQGKSELRVKPQQAVNVTKIAEAALLSSKKGTPIYIELK